MSECRCPVRPHDRQRRIVLTGGPGAGKTAVLELLRRTMCRHVRVLGESAGIIFGGGFPRNRTPEIQRPTQRAIYYVQRELESIAAADRDAALIVCDRGTVDGEAYWPRSDDNGDTLWRSVASEAERELARYDAVIHLRTPTRDGGYNHTNPLRIENAAEAAAIDQRIATVWASHPRRFEIAATDDFMVKANRALDYVRAELALACPQCGALTD